MGVHNSHVDLMIDLYQALLADMAQQWGSKNHWNRDLLTIVNRSSKEGYSFLTKTLPSLGKSIDRSLQTGKLDTPTSFKLKKGAAYPAFLQVLLEQVYDSCGYLKKGRSVIPAVVDLRQICFLVYKYEVEYAPSTIKSTLDNFVKVDEEIGCEKPALPDSTERVLTISRTLLSHLLRDISLRDVCPGHGPGAVADDKKPWDKMNFSIIYETIDDFYPCSEYFYTSARDLAGAAHTYDKLDIVKYPTAVGVCVPKDSRGPRFISKEPSESMWIQQGQKDILYDYVEAHPLTQGHVNFRDQTINGQLALDGSISQDNVTLDMKEASNRISYWLAEDQLPKQVWEPLVATRSRDTVLPDGRLVKLNMFAPMGSALCFPVESLLHWSLAVASLIEAGVSQPAALQAVYVYGDDIIIKGQDHRPLFHHFPLLKLKFNEDKSCVHGFFRESCGVDAYMGELISPIKVKKLFPSSRRDGDKVTAWIEYTNSFWASCYYHLSNLIYDRIKKLTGDLLITGDENTPLALTTPRFPTYRRYVGRRRYNVKLFRYERQVLKVHTKRKTVPCDRSEYLRTLTLPRPVEISLPIFQEEGSNAGVYTIPHRVGLKKGWTPEY